MKKIWIKLVETAIKMITSKRFYDVVKVNVARFFNSDLSGEEKRKKVLEDMEDFARPYGKNLLNFAIELAVMSIKNEK